MGRAGFTLVELLIVIAILAVLAAAVVIVLNPAELLAQARDSQRITDLKTLKDSVDIFIVDNPSTSLGTANRVYISLPDTASNCPNLTASLPALPTGWEYVCATTANLRNTDGTGWVPLNLGSIFGGTPIPYLPIDPSNDLASGRYYTYVMGGSYELTALMEATKENASVSDGGSLPGVFEVGTHIGLTPPTRDKGLVGYWTFDEGSGTTAYDSSGRGNNGILMGGTSWTIVAPHEGLYMDGVDDYISLGANGLPTVQKGTVSFWRKALNANQWLLFKGQSSSHFLMASHGTDNFYHNSAGGPITIYRDGVIATAPLADSAWHYYVATGVDLSMWTALTASNYSTYQYNGDIDDVRVYNRVLSVLEIMSIYEATR
jgi:prepilin-type N-terminal cleavage/methylation domain-containing protein